jgi:hypothetical protein
VYNPVANNAINAQLQSVPGPTAVVWAAPPTVAVGWYQWQGRVVLNAGDVLTLFSSQPAAQFIVSGYLLS